MRVNSIKIPDHMHKILSESSKWIWGEDFYFSFTPQFVLHDDKKEVIMRFDDESKAKRKVIEELGLDYASR